MADYLKKVTYHIGDKLGSERKYPFIFDGVVNTTPKMLCKYDYDSIEIYNDSAEDVYFSLDGGQTYQHAKKLEGRVWDRCTFSGQFWIYCGANTAAVRVTLWRQD